jgi:hypothetical protein
MSIKKITLLFISLLALSTSLMSQAPSWKVNEPDYQHTMTFVAKLNMDGVLLNGQNDMVGAFVGTTCRGVSKPTYVASSKSYYAYLTVFSNTSGETISFQLFNSSNNKVVKVSKTIGFVANQSVGNLFQAYSIAEPTLNNKADILTFDFLNIKSLSSSITPGSVKIAISESFPLNNLTPVFTLSKGASLLRNRIIQSTGSIATSFTTNVNYEVLSEDESALANYTVNVVHRQDPPLFYKKDAVCSALGAVKVVSKREGSDASLTLNGKLIETKAVKNGEAVFQNLVSGTYVATIGSDFKVIIINLISK